MPDARRSNNRTVSEVRSELELVITPTIDGPVRNVYDAWTKVELLSRWWAPKWRASPARAWSRMSAPEARSATC